MPTLTQHKIPISDETIDAVLSHLARYRLTVSTAVATLPQFNGCDIRSVKQVLRVCRQRSLVDSAPLHSQQRYWHLTELGAEHCGVTGNRIGPLSETAKIRAFALLHFCCLSDRPRHRLTAADIVRSFPDLHRPGLPTGYYFDPEATGRIGLARVDAGQHGRWDRVVQSVRDDLSDHVRHSAFRRLIQAGRFEFTLVTVLPQKADRIRDAVAQLPDAGGTRIQVVAIPELLPLIASASGKEVRTG